MTAVRRTKDRDKAQIREIKTFARRHRKERLKFSQKVTIILAATGTKASMGWMHFLNVLYSRYNSEKLFETGTSDSDATKPEIT